jgi:hypothetical protein
MAARRLLACSVHARCGPACPGVRGVLPLGEAETAREPEIEAGQVVHLLGAGMDRVHPPVAAPGEGDQGGVVPWTTPAWL